MEMKKKTVVAIDLSTTGKGGGPFTSTTRIINSILKEKYEFRIINYDTKLGTGISLKRIIHLKNQIKKINPDIVHYTGLQLSGFHMAIACKLAKVNKTVVTIRGFSGDAIYFNPFKMALLTYIIEPITLLMADKIYGVSEYVINRNVVTLFKKKVFGCIYNFPPVINNNLYKTSIREELNIDKNSIIAVSVARITKDKGYHILDEAILHFKETEKLKFIIVGNGSYLSEMQEKLKYQIENKQVFFLGHRDDIQNILRTCNIFVLPTLHETLSLALLEASSESLALIASNTGGVPEIVENDFNGILVEPGDVLQLTKAIDILYQDEQLRKKFGQNAKSKLEHKFSEKSIVQKIDSLYQQLLQ
jgi:glycosyltransferase involved in cell wall biosynthesis